MENKALNGLVRDPKRFRDLVTRRLQGGEKDLAEKMRLVREARAGKEKVSASAVLVPLEFDREKNEYVLILNKRSDRVQQAGDLCCPGGRLDFGKDRLFARLMAWRMALYSRRAGTLSGGRPERRKEKEAVRFVLAGALRECWEEMGLRPWKVQYLGVLSSQELQNLPRIIFPVVGRIRGRWRERPNWEVDKILRLPVRSFFEPDSYVTHRLNLPGTLQEKFRMDRWVLPGLSVPCDGGEEILWGVTFKILLTFMEQTLDLPLDMIQPERTVERDLPEYYYRGRLRGTG